MTRYNIMFHLCKQGCLGFIDYAPDDHRRVIEDYKQWPKIYKSMSELGWCAYWHQKLEDNLDLAEAKEKCEFLNKKYHCYDKHIGLLNPEDKVGVE